MYEAEKARTKKKACSELASESIEKRTNEEDENEKKGHVYKKKEEGMWLLRQGF